MHCRGAASVTTDGRDLSEIEGDTRLVQLGLQNEDGTTGVDGFAVDVVGLFAQTLRLPADARENLVHL